MAVVAAVENTAAFGAAGLKGSADLAGEGLVEGKMKLGFKGEVMLGGDVRF